MTIATGVTPMQNGYRNDALTLAERSVESARGRAAADLNRPVYHFLAPANWMNDPNGPIFYRDWCHLFYQHNPYGDGWNHMHWGHARSRDMVRWEHLPIALWPSRERGEQHCFSGCATLDGSGRPMIFYTSIGHEAPECWAAVPEDESLIRWRKHPSNPILTARSAPIPLFEWRDPYVFQAGGRAYMVHGGNLNDSRGGQAAVSLYRALDPALTRWEYRGILFRHPDPAVSNIECPNFFPLGDKWVLITSPHRACDYFAGTFDPEAEKFTWNRRGMVDFSDQFYAPNGLKDPKGRHIVWGWVRGFPEGQGWNGCLSLPRVLTLDSNGLLMQTPLPELRMLRGRRAALNNVRLEEKPLLVPGEFGRSIELLLEFDRASGSTLTLELCRSTDGRRAIPIRYDEEALHVDSVRVPIARPEGEPAGLRVFLDRSTLEVFADGGRVAVTRVVQPRPDDRGIALSARGGVAVRSLEVWEMKSIW